ncbi:hypothetical protein HMPREF1077_01899 [Parabacteroides johnsonii CL02T12C29]|uniref:Uncharacterized protein n=1 Tax=Parabacteroides johnsonii CL02T12C29 TaxID=999419 RepID=K5Z354_9BACT|nr:hypothetical protein HMPREF1077_01899 [Parabacteroides johnsonii CL02T12C29]
MVVSIQTNNFFAGFTIRQSPGKIKELRQGYMFLFMQCMNGTKKPSKQHFSDIVETIRR